MWARKKKDQKNASVARSCHNTFFKNKFIKFVGNFVCDFCVWLLHCNAFGFARIVSVGKMTAE